jgi:hypothetical protein
MGEQEVQEQENMLYMARHLYTKLGKDVFILDGAATAHMVDEWVQLKGESNISLTVKGLGDMNATGKGVLCVDGLELGPTLRVPGLGINLISEGSLQKQGCEIISKKDWRKVYYQGALIIEAVFKEGLFIWKPVSKAFLKSECCFLAGAKPESRVQLCTRGIKDWDI